MNVQAVLTLCMLCQAVLVSYTADISVALNYLSDAVRDQLLPTEVNVTLALAGSQVSSLRLTRLLFFRQIVPVYSLSLDKKGQPSSRKEKILQQRNAGYYQDLNNEALVHITRTTSLHDKKVRLEMKGHLSISGIRYFMRPLHGDQKKSHQTLVSPPQHQSLKEREDVAMYSLIPLTRFSSRIHNATISNAFYEASMLNETNQAKKLRRSLPRRRQTLTNYYIDIVAVVDYKAYRKFLSKAGSRATAFHDIQQYYAFVFNGMDHLYEGITTTHYRINIRLVKIVVSETVATSPFAEPYHVANSPVDQVDNDILIDKFKEYVLGPGQRSVAPYDHVMLFSGYDFTEVEDNKMDNYVKGVAFTGDACSRGGVSVIEDLDDYTCISTAAHELGHSLAAEHDGDGNSCRATDYFIMSPVEDYPVDEATKLDPWKFSTCTVNYFTSFFSTQLKTSAGIDCVTKTLAVIGTIPNVSTHLLGQEIPPDQQCQLILGPRSQYCRGSDIGNISDICTRMPCDIPPESEYCQYEQALYGTSCGSGKVCIEGACVRHAGAPSIDEKCAFGDTLGIVDEGLTCAQVIHNTPGHCYNDWYFEHCCASCKAVQMTANCLYGNWPTTKYNGMTCEQLVAKDARTYCAIAWVKTNCCGSCSVVG